MENKSSTILVIFGATGDLVSRKLLPAVYHLYKTRHLPKKFKIVGVARRPFTDEEFRKLMKQTLIKKLGEKEKYDDFLKLISYQQGFFDQDETYDSLKKKLNGQHHKLFYLATPPHYYDVLLRKLSGSGLTAQTAGKAWSRIVVEKPFGKDLLHAQDLDKLLGEIFEENQVYRIDHYLAKEILQNIMAFRFANNLLEDVWNRKFVEKIEIKLLEDIDVEGRGEFYDEVGALLDVGQNHLLQMLALVTMDNPGSFHPQDIRKKRSEIIDRLRKMNLEEIKQDTLRAQYNNYRSEKGVSHKSNTETYFKLVAYVDNPRWQNVPIYLESGKKLPAADKAVTITFKHPKPCICPPGVHYKNRVTFRIQPNPGIEIEFWSKEPGNGMTLEKRLLHFNYEIDPNLRYLAEYSRLISDAINGDQTLFVSSREAISSWKFIDPIVETWKKKLTTLKRYDRDDKILKQFDKRQKIPYAFSKFAMVGLGKMGKNLAQQLLDKDFEIVASNSRSRSAVEELSKNPKFKTFSNDQELMGSLPKPRLIWLMVPHTEVDAVLFGKTGLVSNLERGDIVIDAGNSYFKDTIKRGQKLAKKGIQFMDVGFSGGPAGARNGGCLMIGGDKKLFLKLENLFESMSLPQGYKYFGRLGSGHFVKMIHNGIEYGMMQSIAEGFGILKASPFKLNLADVADIYNHGSVIESRLVGWVQKAYTKRKQELKGINGVIGYTGEGEWTVKTAKQLRVPAKVIEESFRFRVRSKKTQTYVSKMVAAMREQFGGHSVK